MFIKELDSDSLEYQTLKKYLINSYELEIYRFINEQEITGDWLYFCDKNNVSGQVEAFIALYNRYLYDCEEWNFIFVEDDVALLMSHQIIPALRQFSFQFENSEYFLNYTSSYLGSSCKTTLDEVKGESFHIKNTTCNNIEVAQRHLKKIISPLNGSIIYKDINSTLTFFETNQSYVLLDAWVKG